MSEFVNYNKRGVSLPPGCKDLVDVLRRRAEGVMGDLTAQGRQTVSHSERIMATVSQAHKYIEMAFLSRAQLFTLAIGTQNERFVVVFTKFRKNLVESAVVFPENSGYEEPLREFLVRNQLTVPGWTSNSAHFWPEVPVYSHYDIVPLPPEPAGAADLIVRLFREVYKLTDEDQLRFHWGEMDYA